MIRFKKIKRLYCDYVPRLRQLTIFPKANELFEQLTLLIEGDGKSGILLERLEECVPIFVVNDNIVSSNGIVEHILQLEVCIYDYFVINSH